MRDTQDQAVLDVSERLSDLPSVRSGQLGRAKEYLSVVLEIM